MSGSSSDHQQQEGDWGYQMSAECCQAHCLLLTHIGGCFFTWCVCVGGGVWVCLGVCICRMVFLFLYKCRKSAFTVIVQWHDPNHPVSPRTMMWPVKRRVRSCGCWWKGWCSGYLGLRCQWTKVNQRSEQDTGERLWRARTHIYIYIYIYHGFMLYCFWIWE